MKMLLLAGLLLISLGVLSLVVPIPSTESRGLRAGGVNLGVQTTHSERVSPVISGLLIVGGIVLSIAGGRNGGLKG